MSLDITYELVISFENKPSLKEDVMNWLIGIGEESFVEGVVDGLDLDYDYENEDKNYYEDLGGSASSISLYKYDKEHLVALKERLISTFGENLSLKLNETDTSEWQEGWKDSFKPFETKRFHVFPPWEAENINSSKMRLEVEPGMAFGTGQHATTQLCLSKLEILVEEIKPKSVLDVGTGTGILAIAVKKMGCDSLLATDIDADAVIAAKENALRNSVDFNVLQDSVPEAAEPCDLVIANILFVVLRRIIGELAGAVQPGGKLLLSGVLSEEASEMIDLAESHGLKFESKDEQDGWVCLVLSK